MFSNQLVDIPENFLCPITLEMMENPVVAADGHTYEKAAIVRWLETGHKNSPFTGEKLKHDVLTDNFALKKTINDFKENLPKIQREQQIKVDLDEAIKLKEEMVAERLKKLERELGKKEEENLYLMEKVDLLERKKPGINKNSTDFNKYVDMLLEALEPNEKELLTKEEILKVIAKDNDEEKDIEQRGIYNLIREKLGNEAINKLNEKISDWSEENDLYSIVKAIYRYKQNYDPNIIDFINKDKGYFIGKFFDFEDPNGNQSTLSKIEACDFYKDYQSNNIVKFSLENSSVFHIEYKNRDVLNVCTSFKRKSRLIDLLKNHIGKSSKTLDGIEFYRQREEFVEDNLRIEPGNYHIELTDKINNEKFFNFFKSDKDKLYQQQLNLYNLDNKKHKYEFLITTNLRNAIEIHILRDKEMQEVSTQDFNSIVCHVIEGSKKIKFSNINPGNIKEYIHIREIESEISKENQKRKEIDDIENNILCFLKADENKKYLNELLDNLVSNKLNFTSEVIIDKSLKKDLDRICQIFNELNMAKTKEIVLKNAVIEATYSKLVDKNKKLFIFKIMNLLEEAFQHIDSVRKMDLVMFWGGTGAGKSVSINYYLGHALEAYNNYGRVYLRLKEKDLKEGTYAKIGQSIATSETTFIHGYKPKDKNLKNLMLCDCPGFEDSRGEVYDLSTMLSIDNAIKNASSIKSIVLTLPYEDFWGTRCRSVMKLFENLKEKVPEIFANKEIRKSVFLLITKYNKNEPIEKNLKLAVNDALSDERSMLYNLENKEELKDDVQIKIIKEKIEIWTFVLDVINSKRIINIDIRDKALRRECLQEFLNAQGVEKKYFSKSMDSDTVQRNFSKYISIHIDTWKKHILKKYGSELPQRISTLNEKIKSIGLHVLETEQKNKNIEQSITSKEDEIDKIKFTNEKLKNLLNSKNEKLIEEELKKNEEFKKHAQDIRQNRLKRLEQDIREIQERIDENSIKAKNLERESNGLKTDIEELKEENNSLSDGNTEMVLYKYRQLGSDENLTYETVDDLETKSRQAFNSVSELNTKGVEHTVKAGQYTGEMWHYAYVSKDYYIVPKNGSSMNLMDMYNKEFLQEGRKYRAVIEGEGWEFNLGVKAHPERKKMVYSIKTKWNAGGTIPWFSITHDLPNVDINEAKIINNDAEIKSLNKTIIENSKEINRLMEKNKELQKDINLKIKNKNDSEEESKKEQAQYNYNELQKIIDKNSQFVEDYKKDIKKDYNEIKSNSNIIESDRRTIEETQAIVFEEKKQKLHLAIIIKSKIGVAELLRKFAALSTEGLGIKKENADKDLVFDLIDYAKYYDSNIEKILSMCNEDLNIDPLLINNNGLKDGNVLEMSSIELIEQKPNPMILNQYKKDKIKNSEINIFSIHPGEFIEESRKMAEQKGLIGPREIINFQLKDVNDKGNCFYESVADQLQLLNHSFITHVPKETELHDSLRLKLQGKEFCDKEWAEDKMFDSFATNFQDVILAVIDTRNPNAGFVCHYWEGNEVITNTGDMNKPLPSERGIVRIAATGNHFLSVISHPKLDSGAIIDAFNQLIEKQMLKI